ncbi:hypothetical protein BKA83DRAFT_4292395, partial [Pisolithus microcarpus]
RSSLYPSTYASLAPSHYFTSCLALPLGFNLKLSARYFFFLFHLSSLAFVTPSSFHGFFWITFFSPLLYFVVCLSYRGLYILPMASC